nr:MAG TPA: Terminase small subunit [Caudoviricetes sp.]
MPKAKDQRVDTAFELYKQGLKLVDIAERLKVPAGTVRRWKSTYDWEGKMLCKDSERSEKNSERSGKNNKMKKKAISEDVIQTMENPELTDKQQLFCLYYVRCFNATKAYQKAYGCSYEVANAEGYKLLVNPCTKNEIQRLKQNRLNRELLDEHDIFQKYLDIAYSDITDYVEFGQEEQPVMAIYGPVQIKDEKTGKKINLTKCVNVVRFRESAQVDGTLISEVKQGKDGASIKLADKMKALQWLSDHMDMATEEQKARIAVLKAQIDTNNDEQTSDPAVERFLQAVRPTGDELTRLFGEENGSGEEKT